MTGYRTILAAVAVVLLGALQAAGTVDWIGLVGSAKAGGIVSAIGVAMGVLRWITTTPIGDKP
jgi:hypothetical protein